MRNQWRLLLLRRRSSLLSAPPAISTPLISSNNHGNKVRSSLSSFSLSPLPTVFPNTSALRFFSSDPAPRTTVSDHSSLIDIFSKPISGDEIKQQLDSNNIVISHDLVLEALKNLKSNPEVAIKLFGWVLERDGERLSSNSYNLMVGILGSNGFVKEFWDMVEIMRNKGYGVKRGAFDCVLEKFEKEGLESDSLRLKSLFDYRKPEGSTELVSRKIGQLIRPAVWGDDVETKIKELGVDFSSDLVKVVVESIATEPMKALIFFRWVEETGLLKHDELTYNAMAVVLAREDCVDRFWNVVGEMRSAGYEIQMETFVKVLDRFSKRKMLKDCVDLYEIAMKNENGANKPSIQDCAFILRKVAAANELDMDLLSRVLGIVAESGNELPDSAVNSVLKSLAGVGRIDQSRLILDAMRANGLEPNSRVRGNVGFRLSRSGKNEEATEYGSDETDHHTWISLFRGHCLAGNLSKASECFKKSVELDSGISDANVGYNLEMLVDAYCRRGKAAEASAILKCLVKEKGLKPRHTTYKMLIGQLLARKGGLGDALDFIDLMKGHGFPPYLDPFVEYVSSKRGNAQDGLVFLKAMTVKKFPATSVFVRVFEAYFKAGRSREAQSLLAICPQFIRNNADVLDLFYNNVEARRIAKAPQVEVVSAS